MKYKQNIIIVGTYKQVEIEFEFPDSIQPNPMVKKLGGNSP